MSYVRRTTHTKPGFESKFIVQDQSKLSYVFDQVSCSITVSYFDIHISEKNHNDVYFQIQFMFRQYLEIQCV